MDESDFAIGNSLLFSVSDSQPDVDIEPHSSLSLPGEGESNKSVLSQSILFTPQPNLSLETGISLNGNQNSATSSFQKNDKVVRLLDGTTMKLRPRYRKKVTIIFDEDLDVITSMDKLYERVKQKESLRESQNNIQKQKKIYKPAESACLPQLWSEKYKPKSYLQLCPAGNERQYRLIMQWLQTWDHTVFKKAKNDNESVDSSGRPSRKILLVHGPPGIGKTAAVHLLAQRAGYAVEELNAANSMNALQGVDATEGAGRFANATAALRLKVKNALTTNTITSKGKPTCLVIDEIESSMNTGDIVRVLSEMVRTDQSNMRAKEGQSATKDPRKKSSKKPFFINRPIICIANDIYNTSSRSGSQNPMETLRPLCEIVAVRKAEASSSSRARVNVSARQTVKEFLMRISEAEQVGLDRKEIAEVFEVCDGDIRACINYLQFSSRKLDSDIQSFGNEGTLANKDTSISWFALVDRIFRRNQHISKEEDFEEMLDLVTTGGGKSAISGSLDKVIKGCFNQYLDIVHLQDDSVVRPAEISDWLFYYDLFTTQKLSAHFYPTLAGLKFWSLFSDINSHKLRDVDGLIPDAKNLDFNSRELSKQNKSVIRKIIDQVPIDAKAALCGMSNDSAFYACEFIPFLDKMLSPEIGSSKSKNLLKDYESEQIEKLASLIKSLDIKLETQREMGSNQIQLVYAPDWEGITIWSSGDQNLEQQKRSLNAKRQWLFPLLQTEFDLMHHSLSSKRNREKGSDGEKPDAKQKKAKFTSSLDFFKGRYDDMSTKMSTPTKPVNREATRIWVKHHEGFSNAVRKNIGWHELWN